MVNGMNESKRVARAVPSWVPNDVRNYVFHTEMGQAIRLLARSQSCHASTIMRQVHKVEQRRDDPLVDRAIQALAEEGEGTRTPTSLELMQALRRLALPNALLAISMEMAQGLIVCDTSKATQHREQEHASTIPINCAQVLALQGWITSTSTTTRVLRYRITPAGRVVLRELTAKSENAARSMAEGPARFEGAPKGVATWDDKPIQARPSSYDTPVQALSRRKDLAGKPFISRSMVRAAERLREGFELAHIARNETTGPTLDWDEMLVAIETRKNVPCPRSPAVRQVVDVLEFLGPGLSEVALRCCCLLEGLETTEKHMGWAARSGKVVLRIALQRLVLYYQDRGELGPKIG